MFSMSRELFNLYMYCVEHCFKSLFVEFVPNTSLLIWQSCDIFPVPRRSCIQLNYISHAHLSYEKRLTVCGLTTMETRRRGGNQICNTLSNAMDMKMIYRNVF